jgi:hypothetical protein
MVKTETQIRYEGMHALVERLGMIDAERFISSISRERFDYTEWQRNLWQDQSVEDTYQMAKERFEQHPS